MRVTVFTLICVMMFVPGAALAGDIDSPGTPGDGSDMPTLQEIYEYLISGTGETPNASFEESVATPGATMKSTREIYDAIEDERTSDLSAENIRKDVEIFGVTGTYEAEYPAPVPKTGDSSDGNYGVASPDPRFTNPDGTTPVSGDVVLDQLTGLMWTKDADLDEEKTWADAKTYCDGLSHGGYDDWRLPNLRELQSLMDYSVTYLPSGHPFTNTRFSYYWSSTPGAGVSGYAWSVHFGYDGVNQRYTSYEFYVWPVRGGQ